MSYPNSPRILKGGIALLDSSTGIVQRVIALQYNPDTVTRTLQVQGAGPETGDHLEALRLKGPPIETIKLEAEIDATDHLEDPDNNADFVTHGIAGPLALLETIVYPPSDRTLANDALASIGIIEIAPLEAPLTVFVWSAQRVVPVRLTDFSITEEAFDPKLNPIRAKVSLTMRVLSNNDLGFANKGGSLFVAYHKQKELLAASTPASSLGSLGIQNI